jgi:hypothetical protein
MNLPLKYKIRCLLEDGINHQNNDFVVITELEFDGFEDKFLWHGWIYPAFWEFDNQKNRWVAQYDPFWHQNRVLLDIKNIEKLDSTDKRWDVMKKMLDQINNGTGDALVSDKEAIKKRFKCNKFVQFFVL